MKVYAVIDTESQGTALLSQAATKLDQAAVEWTRALTPPQCRDSGLTTHLHLRKSADTPTAVWVVCPLSKTYSSSAAWRAPACADSRHPHLYRNMHAAVWLSRSWRRLRSALTHLPAPAAVPYHWPSKYGLQRALCRPSATSAY